MFNEVGEWQILIGEKLSEDTFVGKSLLLIMKTSS